MKEIYFNSINRSSTFIGEIKKSPPGKQKDFKYN